jgi:hypothetical protein
MIQPSAAIKTPFPPTSSSSTIRTINSEITGESQKASRTEMISSSIESHRSETKSEQKFHMKLEHKPAPFDSTQREEKILSNNGNYNIIDEKSEIIENENIETSSMARKDALSFFESMSKASDNLPKGPREMIKLTNEDDGTGPGCDVRVEQLTKNYERSTKFEEANSEIPKPDIQAGKKVVQEIFNKFERGSSSRGIDNTMFDFPYEEHKLAPLQCTRTILEDVTASGSPIHGTLTISKLEAQSQSAEAMLKGFNLIPEPPPEIGYAPKPEDLIKKRPDVSIKAKQLQESFASYSSVDAPIGGVKIFPSSVQQKTRPKTPDIVSGRSISIPPPFELDDNEIIEDTRIKKNTYEKKEYDGYSSSTSTDALAMEKSWAHKSTDSSKKSWPPEQKTTSFIDKQEWSLPEQNYKVSSSESKQEIELKPEYRCTQTTIESSSSLEKKSYGSKEIHVTENKIVPPPSPPKSQPIIYNAETIKVDHTVNTVEEKSITEKYVAECGIQKIETTEKTYDSTKKQTARPWPDGSDLRAPSLVRKVSDNSKPTVKLYHQASPIDLQPGTPPELAYTPGPYIQENKVEKIEKTLDRSLDRKPTFIPIGGVKTISPSVHSKKTQEYISRDYKINKPTAPSQPMSSSNKYSRSSFYNESDYESEIDNVLKSKWRSYESDNEQCANGYRRVKAPVCIQPCRPKSTESEPVPPTSFEVPSHNLTGSSRSLTTSIIDESLVQKSSTNYQKDSNYQDRSRQSQQYDILPKPGSPPIYVQPIKPTSKTFKPEPPIFKTKNLHQESGYMADTDEPLHLQQHKSFSASSSSFSESKASFMETKSYSSTQQKKEDSLSQFTQSQSYSNTPKTNEHRISFVEKIIEKSPQQQYRPTLSKVRKSKAPCINLMLMFGFYNICVRIQ